MHVIDRSKVELTKPRHQKTNTYLITIYSTNSKTVFCVDTCIAAYVCVLMLSHVHDLQ